MALNDTRFAGDELHSVVPGYHREPMLPGQPGGWTLHEQSTPGAFSPMGGLYSSARDRSKWADLYLKREVPSGVSFAAADLLKAQQPLCLIGSDRAEAPVSPRVTVLVLVRERSVDEATVTARGVPLGPDDGTLAPWAAVA